MAAGQATAQASQTALVERLGALPVEHGRHLCDLRDGAGIGGDSPSGLGGDVEFFDLSGLAPRPTRTTKDGRFRPLALANKALPPLDPHDEASSPLARGFAWIWSDISHRLTTGLSWAVCRAPVLVHVLWFLTMLKVIYTLTRPLLLVRSVVWCSEHFLRIVTSSGAELLHELDN